MAGSISRLLAASTRTATLRSRVPPTGRIWPFSRVLSSWAWTSGGSSPTSSRKSVPPSAPANMPRCSRSAPENAPLTWPNSSLPESSGRRVAQLTARKGPVTPLRPWIDRATTSLPVPVSPVISTLKSDGATSSTCSSTRRMAGDPATTPGRGERQRSLPGSPSISCITVSPKRSTSPTDSAARSTRLPFTKLPLALSRSTSASSPPSSSRVIEAWIRDSARSPPIPRCPSPTSRPSNTLRRRRGHTWPSTSSSGLNRVHSCSSVAAVSVIRRGEIVVLAPRSFSPLAMGATSAPGGSGWRS